LVSPLRHHLQIAFDLVERSANLPSVAPMA
jgi:hypothetical protein